MKIVSKIALVAAIGLALTFTLSCSDDDKSGGWLTCEKAEALVAECRSKYVPERDACKDEACVDAVNVKLHKCTEDAICNGTSVDVCNAHYAEDCSNN